MRPGDHVISAQGRAGAKNDEGLDRLAVARARDAGHADLDDVRVGGEDLLDLARPDAMTTGLDVHPLRSTTWT